MGGTSTDVSRYDGHLEHTFDTTNAGVPIQAPQLDIQTVRFTTSYFAFVRYMGTNTYIIDLS
jgi:hypothetical protein